MRAMKIILYVCDTWFSSPDLDLDLTWIFRANHSDIASASGPYISLAPYFSDLMMT